MDEKKFHIKQREKIKYLELQNENLENLLLKKSNEFETVKDKLEEQVSERTLHLQEQKEQLQAITDNVPGVVFQFYSRNNGESGVRYTSQKLFDIFGLEFIDDPPTLLQTFISIIHEEDRQSFIDSIQEVVEKQITWKWTGRYVKPSGEIIWFEGNSIPTVRKDEIIFDGILIDFTEQKQAAEVLRKVHDELEQRVVERTEELKRTHKQLLHVEKLSAIGKLSASIAHEFNNAFYGIQSVIEGIKRHFTLDEEYQKLSDLALSECDRARDLIRGLQDFNKPTSGEKEAVDIHMLLNEMLTMIEKEYKTANITLIKRYAPDLPNIQVVPDQVKQVFLNLLTNAKDAIVDQNGAVTVTTENLGSEIAVRIKDTGNGISAANLPLIFEPFFTTKSAIKGTGLGLSVSYGIIRGHGGDIKVDSVLGQGTTVSIFLPLMAS